MSKFALIIGSERLDLKITESAAFGGKQSVIVYESPGSDGGVVVTTGRTNESVVLSGKILADNLTDANTIRQKITNARDVAEPITLVAPIDDGRSGRYLIETFNYTLILGIQTYIVFDITLIENRQANIKRNSVNLVNFEQGELLRQRNLLAQK